MNDNFVSDPLTARSVSLHYWQRWASLAALAWSLGYAILGVFWIISGHGFPYEFGAGSDPLGPAAAKFGPTIAWIIVLIVGFPAVVVGEAMQHGVRIRSFRYPLIIAGGLLSGSLLLMMTGLDLLVKVGYIPVVIAGLLDPEKFQAYLSAWVSWPMIHQLVCMLGGFLWLAATVSYARQSGDACLYCGRNDASEAWTSKMSASRWGRIAVYVAMVPPIFYAFTRICWALGIPLGMSLEALHRGQETGIWIGGLSLAAFNVVGVILMLGLVQHWGEVFPRWMIGLAGRRVPIALAVVPASLASVLLFVGGIGIWFGLPQMIANLQAAGSSGFPMIWEAFIQVGPTLLFPVWGVGLAVATLGYYYRRRSPCKMCGRGSA